MVTPLKAEIWSKELATHPDQLFCQYIIRGLREGFRVGFDYENSQLRSNGCNLLSAADHPEVVDDYLAVEKSFGRLGVIPQHLLPAIPIHISPFGVIPKKSKPGKWRLIIDLSSPMGWSVNDGIEKELCSMSYVSIDQVVDCVLSFETGALMAKIDIKQAYRNVPVHPDDRHLLAMQWRNEILVDKVLPFGLRSAPLIFSAVADALQWIIQRRRAQPLFHYLDDYITVGPPNSELCQINLDTIKSVCAHTGVPLEDGKCEGPTTCIIFLGMELNSVAKTIRLPDDKLEKLKCLLDDFGGRKAARKRELLSLIGHLQHASKAVRQGRSFVRRLIDLAAVVKRLDGFVRLNISARSDIAWWRVFAKQWNGTSMLYNYRRANPQIHVFSDASGSWGCGAYSGKEWFQLQWPTTMPGCHISVKEMIPVVIAAVVWGQHWRGLSIRFHSDNSAVVALLNTGSVRDDSLMHLMRCLAIIAARYNFIFSSSHIRGQDNGLADALSRNDSTRFLSTYSQAQAHPTPLPPMLLNLLLEEVPDWTSSSWIKQWISTFNGL